MIRLIIASLLIPSICFAAPTISDVTGTTSDGESITITGTNFGAKATAAPLVFDNFDANDTGRQNTDTINGESCSDQGSWSASTLDNIPTYTNTNQRTGSTLSSRNDQQDGAETNHCPMFNTFSVSHKSTILVSFWLRTDFVQFDASVVKNYKIWRINNGAEQDLNTSFQMGTKTNQVPTNGFVGVFPGGILNDTWAITYINQTWQHYIVALKASSNGVADGTAIIWVDGTEVVNSNAVETWATGDEWTNATFGWAIVNTLTNDEVVSQWDDIYIDDSFQTVWLTNATTWAGSSVREIQIQTSRSDTSISISSFNQGAFAESATAYLYVMDANGDVNASGYEITIGAAAGGSSGSVTRSGTGTITRSGTGSITRQ